MSSAPPPPGYPARVSSRAVAWIRLPDPPRVAPGHGDLIGRVGTAARVLDDPPGVGGAREGEPARRRAGAPGPAAAERGRLHEPDAPCVVWTGDGSGRALDGVVTPPREGRIRADRVHAAGTGRVELRFRPDETVEDHA